MNRRCKSCRRKAKYQIGLAGWCGSSECKDKIVNEQAKHALKLVEKQRRQKLKVDRANAESLQDVITKAQRDFNKWIRTYDLYHYGCCISTGEEISDAGHLYHRGSKYRTSWLTLMHFNLHGQSAHANRFKGGGDGENFRLGLAARYGQDYLASVDEFKAAEDRGEIPKPTKEEVRACAAWCRAMTRIYERKL